MEGLIILLVTIVVVVAAISAMSVLVGIPLAYIYDAIASWVYPTLLQRDFTASQEMPWQISSCIVFVLLLIGWAFKSNVTVKKG